MIIRHSRTIRRVFLGSLITAIVGVLALSSWLLFLPLWQIHRAGQRPIPWQDYSSDRLAQLMSERRDTLLITVADWDISGHYLRTMIDTPRVRRAIESREIVPVLVNLTNPSAETDALREFFHIPENTFLFAVIISGDTPDEPVTIVDWSGPNDEQVFQAIQTIPPRKPSWK